MASRPLPDYEEGMLSEDEYVRRAQAELKQLVEALDERENEHFEVELENDILTLEFQDGSQFVINSHRAARQIWMAAERSAWHFDWQESSEKWLSSKTQEELWATLERVLSGKLGQTFSLR